MVLLSTVIAGCTVGPNYQTPQVETPATFGALPATRPTTTPVATDYDQWWKTFNDAALNSLVDQALSGNLDVHLAAARLAEARAQRGVTVAGEFPTISSAGAYSHSRSSRNIGSPSAASGGGASAGQGGGGGGGFGSLGTETDFYQAGFDAGWEVDLFGGIRRAVEAASANVQVAQESRRDIAISVAAEVALNYIELRGLQRQREIVLGNLAAQKDTVSLTQSRFQAGVSGELDVKRAQALVATTQSTLPPIEQATQRAINRLGVLVGRPPRTLASQLTVVQPMPTIPPAIPIGLPSELLRRRPDIRRSERQLAAATAQIGVATADLFPKFSLTGSFGLQSSEFRSVGNWDSRFWSMGPAVSWPIFDAGRIGNNIKVQNARQEQALSQYQQSVLGALEEVENALVAYAQEQLRAKFLQEAASANRRAVELSTELYTKGLSDFLSVLEAQRSLFVAEDQLIQSQRAVAVSVVALYKALGGGW